MKKINYIIVCAMCFILIGTMQVDAKKLTSEAKSVIQRIQTKGSTLSEELTEFHKEFSAHAEKIVQLEAMKEDLINKGYLGKNYKDSPAKHERIYAEYAKYVSEIKDVFVNHYPKIQSAVADFNRSVYHGKDRITELRSDDLAVVENELGKSKQILYKLKNKRSELETNCPQDNPKMTKNCQRQWRNYKRQLINLKRSLARLQYMKKISNLKESIGKKLTQIMDQFVYKEAETVDMLMNYAVNFEQYANFIGSNGLGSILRNVKDLGNLNVKLKDLERFQKGLNFHVADMGNIIDKRMDYFMQNSGMEELNVESRGEMLTGFDGQIDQIENMIKSLEK